MYMYIHTYRYLPADGYQIPADTMTLFTILLFESKQLFYDTKRHDTKLHVKYKVRNLSEIKKHRYFLNQHSKLFNAICKAPALSLCPPINPEACTNTQSGTPIASDKTSSRKPI